MFLPWGRLYLDKPHVMVSFLRNVDAALGMALDHDFGRVYLIWWNTEIGWYEFEVPQDFAEVYSAYRISVYEYFG